MRAHAHIVDGAAAARRVRCLIPRRDVAAAHPPTRGFGVHSCTFRLNGSTYATLLWDRATSKVCFQVLFVSESLAERWTNVIRRPCVRLAPAITAPRACARGTPAQQQSRHTPRPWRYRGYRGPGVGVRKSRMQGHRLILKQHSLKTIHENDSYHCTKVVSVIERSKQAHAGSVVPAWRYSTMHQAAAGAPRPHQGPQT